MRFVHHQNIFLQKSSLNIISHYRAQHKCIAINIVEADSTFENRGIIQRGIREVRRNLSELEKCILPRKTRALNVPSKVLLRRVVGVVLAESRQLTLEMFETAEFEALVECSGGADDNSKNE